MMIIKLCDEVLELKTKNPSWEQIRKNYITEATLKDSAPILARACKLMYENIQVWNEVDNHIKNPFINILEEVEALFEKN